MSTFSAKFSPFCRKELKEQEAEKPGKPFPSECRHTYQAIGWCQGMEAGQVLQVEGEPEGKRIWHVKALQDAYLPHYLAEPGYTKTWGLLGPSLISGYQALLGLYTNINTVKINIWMCIKPLCGWRIVWMLKHLSLFQICNSLFSWPGIPALSNQNGWIKAESYLPVKVVSMESPYRTLENATWRCTGDSTGVRVAGMDHRSLGASCKVKLSNWGLSRSYVIFL